jgi:hypothetical protein
VSFLGHRELWHDYTWLAAYNGACDAGQQACLAIGEGKIKMTRPCRELNIFKATGVERLNGINIDTLLHSMMSGQPYPPKTESRLEARITAMRCKPKLQTP